MATNNFLTWFMMIILLIAMVKHASGACASDDARCGYLYADIPFYNYFGLGRDHYCPAGGASCAYICGPPVGSGLLYFYFHLGGGGASARAAFAACISCCSLK